MKFRLVLLILIAVAASSSGAPTVRWQRQFGGEFWDRNSFFVLTSKNEPVVSANIVVQQKIQRSAGETSVDQSFHGVLIKYSIDNRELWKLKTTGDGSLSLNVNYRDNQDRLFVYARAEGPVSFGGQEVPFGPGIRLLDLQLSTDGELLKIERHRYWGHKGYAVRLVYNDEDAKRFGLTYDGVLRLMAARLDPEGKPMWVRQVADMEGTTRIGTSERHDLSVLSGRMVTDHKGNYFVLSIYNPSDGARPYRCVMNKLNAVGDVLWSKQIGKGRFRVQQMLIDGSDNVFLVGFAKGKISFGDRESNANSRADLFVAKFSPQGECRWLAHGGGGELFSRRAAAVDQRGNVCLAGSMYAQGIMKFGAIEFEPKSPMRMMYVTKVSSRGEFKWLRTFSGEGQADPRDLKVGPNGWIYVNGDFGGLNGGSLRTETGELITIPPRKATITPRMGKHFPAWEIFLMGLR